MPFLVVMPVAQVIPPPINISLYGVHASDPANVWVAGGRNNKPYVASWNGTIWATYYLASAFGALQPVFGGLGSDAWVSPFSGAQVYWWDGAALVAQTPRPAYFTGAATAPRAYQLSEGTHAGNLTWYDWTGSGWGSEQFTAPTNATYSTLFLDPNFGPGGGKAQYATTRPDGVQYVIGRAVDTALRAVVLRNTGGVVEEVRRISGAGTFDNHRIWAASNSDIYLLYSASAVPQLVHSDGSGTPELWFNVTLPVGESLDIHGVGPADWWLLHAASASHWDGASYTTYTLPAPWGSPYLQLASSLWAVASDDVWVCGYGQETSTSPFNGVVWHWDGAAWTVVTVFTT